MVRNFVAVCPVQPVSKRVHRTQREGRNPLPVYNTRQCLARRMLLRSFDESPSSTG